MKKYLDNLLFLFPVMFYFLIEALIVGVFISIIWKLFLSQFLGTIGYFQITAIYWIVKMLFFNVFSLISGLATVGRNMEDDGDPDNLDYNETISE